MERVVTEEDFKNGVEFAKAYGGSTDSLVSLLGGVDTEISDSVHSLCKHYAEMYGLVPVKQGLNEKVEEIENSLRELNDNLGNIEFVSSAIGSLHSKFDEIVDLIQNNGWVLCSDSMPKTAKPVLVSYEKEHKTESYKTVDGRYIKTGENVEIIKGTCKAAYISYRTVLAEDMWTDWDDTFEQYLDFDEENDKYYAKEGWYESVDFFTDCYTYEIDAKIIAWKPLEVYMGQQRGI